MVVDERGARNALLNESAHAAGGVGLQQERGAGREHGVVDRGELVHPAADDPAHVLAEEHLVLHEGAALVAIVAVGRQRHVEPVVPEVAAERERIVRADGARVACFDVEGLGVEPERQERAGRAARQQVRGVRRQQVGEERHAARALLILGGEVRQIASRGRCRRARCRCG